MEWSDVKALVSKLAPTIAAGLGGPVAGSAVAALEAVFGINTAGTTEDKQAALVPIVAAATQDQLLALKVAEQDFALKMADLGFKNTTDLEKLAADDRDSARKREVDIKDNTPKILAYSVTLGYFGLMVFMCVSTPPAASRDILNIMLGTLGTAWGAVMAYYFGSTKGSAEKSKLLAAAATPS